MKGLNDPARPVRVKAGNALGLLSQIHVRIDPIFVELLNGLKSNDEASFKYAREKKSPVLVIGFFFV